MGGKLKIPDLFIPKFGKNMVGENNQNELYSGEIHGIQSSPIKKVGLKNSLIKRSGKLNPQNKMPGSG